MSQFWKNVKKYERSLMLGLLIIILATFSVTGLASQCSSTEERTDARDMGGSFVTVSGRKVKVSDHDFRAVHARYAPIYLFPSWGPSLKWGPDIGVVDGKDRMNYEAATWAHIATVASAEDAGYRVGDQELAEGIRNIVTRAQLMGGRRPEQGGLSFTPALYDRVLQVTGYRQPKADFERTVREILLKDKYLTPILDSLRFSEDRASAYDQWKAGRERVDLRFAAVSAKQFADRVAKEEATRSTIARQSELFQRLVSSAQEGRRVLQRAQEHKEKNGAFAKDEAELVSKEPGKVAFPGGKLPNDGWGKPFAYALVGDAPTVVSAGPDGQAGTADDVGAEVLDVLQALGTLRTVGDAAHTWQGVAKAWPAALPELTTAPKPPEAGPAVGAPLATLPKDPWGRELAYDPAGPVLLSTGPDGARGTADDVVAELKVDGVRVPVPERLAPFLVRDAKDAWDRPFLVQLRVASPLAFETTSTGPDGALGGDDDLKEGNGLDLQAFFTGIALEYRLPPRHEFEMLHAAPVLIPDEILAKAWKAHPEWRPTEQEAFDHFTRQEGVDYVTKKVTGEGAEAKEVEIDPADPEKGYGIPLLTELKEAKRIPAEAKGVQVPAAESFGDLKDPPAAQPGIAPGTASDPRWKVYVEKRWRPIVLRDMFVEKMMNDLLTRSRVAAAKHATWETAGRSGPEPAIVTLNESLAGLADLQPSTLEFEKGARFVERFATSADAPIDRTEIERLPGLGDINLTQAFQRQKSTEYGGFPLSVKNGAVRVLLHVTKVHPEREQKVDEVREKIWPRYLEHRALERAYVELGQVRVEAGKPDAKLDEVVAQVAAKRKFEYVLGSTGLFVGSAGGGRPLVPSPSATDEEKAALLRRDYVRRYGYDSVRPSGGLGEARAVAVGTVGRQPLKDRAKPPEGTESAYLVQVASREDPAPEELTTREYAAWLRNAAYERNQPFGRDQAPLRHRKGFLMKAYAKFLDDWDEIRATYQITTNSMIEMPKASEPRR